VLELNRVKFGFGSVLGLGHSCSGWIRSGMSRFEFGSVRLISGLGLHWFISGSGLHRINKISGWFDFGLGHFGLRIKSGQHDFGSVWFRVGSILVSDRNQFRSFGCRIRSGFGSFGSVHSVRVSFARSRKAL